MRIYTVGHFDYSLDKFQEMLQTADVTFVMDVRAFPNSKSHPQYNQESFQAWLEDNDVKYFHNKLLGGRRKRSGTVGENLNEGWKNQSFHNYADYTLTDDFKQGIKLLMEDAMLLQDLKERGQVNHCSCAGTQIQCRHMT